jgi:hypothetical protein
MPPLKPRGKTLTPEAQAHLAAQGVAESRSESVVIDSDTDYTPLFPGAAAVSDGTDTSYYVPPDAGDVSFGAPEFIEPETPSTKPAGDAIDEAIATTPDESPAPVKEKPITETLGFGRRTRKSNTTPKVTAPDKDEWLDFFSRIVIRFGTEWYVDAAFHGIDEDLVSEADAAKLLLTEEERDTIAAPYAAFAHKNPWMKKHGREILALSDSFESTIILARWFMRVNRIARKYKPKQPKQRRVQGRVANNGNQRQSTPSPTETGGSGSIPEFPVYNPGSS